MTDFFKFRQIIEEKNNRLNEASTKELKDLDIGDDVMVNGEMGMFYGMQGSKVKVRFPSGQKTVSAKDVEIKDLMMDDLEKDADDPCWEGYVQVGTKMEDGKEVPNCVPIEEARKQMDEASRKTEKELSKLMTKALDGKRPKSDYTSEIANNGDFVVKDGGGRVVGRIKKGDFEDPMKENVNESYYDYPDYGPVGASEMAQTQLHFIKYAADDVTRCLKSGCPMPEWYQNKLAKIEGDMEGLYSYMKGKTRKMKHENVR
jgi:vacuolar-type H+-ATPase subunit H